MGEWQHCQRRATNSAAFTSDTCRLSGGSSSDVSSIGTAAGSGYESESDSDADTDTGYSSDLHLDRSVAEVNTVKVAHVMQTATSPACSCTQHTMPVLTACICVV